MVETKFDALNIEYQDVDSGEENYDYPDALMVSVDVPNDFKDKHFSFTEDLIRAKIEEMTGGPFVKVVDFTAFYNNTFYTLRGNYEDYEQKAIKTALKNIEFRQTFAARENKNAEYNVEFNEWADQEMNSHGKNISFKDWAEDEGMKHGNSEITDWAEHEDESHDARYGAEDKIWEDYPEPLSQEEKDDMQAGLPPREVALDEGTYEWIQENTTEDAFDGIISHITHWFNKYQKCKDRERGQFGAEEDDEKSIIRRYQTNNLLLNEDRWNTIQGIFLDAWENRDSARFDLGLEVTKDALLPPELYWLLREAEEFDAEMPKRETYDFKPKDITPHQEAGWCCRERGWGSANYYLRHNSPRRDITNYMISTMCMPCLQSAVSFATYEQGWAEDMATIPYFESEELKRDSCCCGATKSNPCACMIQGIMKCSATCPCSLEKKGAETYEDSWEKGVIRLAIDSGCFTDEYAEWVSRQIDGASSTLNNPRFKEIIDKRWGLNAENWGGDPEGKLAQALAKARKKAKKVGKTLKIEKLDAESWGETHQATIEHFLGYSNRYSPTERIEDMVGGSYGFAEEDIDWLSIRWYLNDALTNGNIMSEYGEDNVKEALEMLKTMNAETSGQWEIGEQLEEAQMNAEYEDCEVCYATVDKGTLNDVQAGRICNECHRMNQYTGGTRTIKTPYNAESFSAPTKGIDTFTKPFEEMALDNSIGKSIVVGLGIGALALFGYNKWK